MHNYLNLPDSCRLAWKIPKPPYHPPSRRSNGNQKDTPDQFLKSPYHPIMQLSGKFNYTFSINLKIIFFRQILRDHLFFKTMSRYGTSRWVGGLRPGSKTSKRDMIKKQICGAFGCIVQPNMWCIWLHKNFFWSGAQGWVGGSRLQKK